MRVIRRALPSACTPERALLRLDQRARRIGLPAPAALTGQWFGSRAVIAPSVQITCPEVGAAFAIPDQIPGIEGDTVTQAAASDPNDNPAESPTGSTVGGPVGGGWFGFLSYDLTDPASPRGAPPRASRGSTGLPRAGWGWADHVLRLDAAGTWWFEALVPDGAREPDELRAELAELLARPAASDAPGHAGWAQTSLQHPDAGAYRDAVRGAITAINAGEIFQANICTRMHGTFTGAPATLFAEGVGTLQPRRASYLAGPWGALVSFSPELFLARRGQQVHSTPIKGTQPRRAGAADPDADPAAARLRESTKDVAENVMITDLVRNDLAQVSRVGSVGVPELLAVRPAPGVWHLESTVAATLIPGASDADLLAAAFPPGSVTGAPKLRALELIAELEAHPRGVYCGALGLISPVAGMELAVAIRTLELHPSSGNPSSGNPSSGNPSSGNPGTAGQFTVELGVGGGITAESDPELEWQECLHKAAPLEKLLAAPPRRSPREHAYPLFG